MKERFMELPLTKTTTTFSADEHSTEPMSVAIIEAVAEASGVDPLDLDPLYDVVDPDALDSVIADSAITISFRFAGHRVTADGSGRITVDAPV